MFWLMLIIITGVFLYLLNSNDKKQKKIVQLEEEVQKRCEEKQRNLDDREYKSVLLEEFNKAKSEMEKNHLDYRRELKQRYEEAKYKMLCEEKKYRELLRTQDEVKNEATHILEQVRNEACEIKKSAENERKIILENAELEANCIKEKTKNDCLVLLKDAEENRRKLQKDIEEYKRVHENINTAIDKRMEEFKEKENFFFLKVKDIPVLAKYFADVEEARHDEIINYLRYNKKPALKSADIVKTLKSEKVLLKNNLKIAEYKVKFYENMFPWLLDLNDEPLDNKLCKTDICNEDDDNNKDVVRHWLTENEYENLSDTEKYQLALERYQKRNKTKLEIGLDFERFVGYTYEMQGYEVQYRGIIDGFEDLGRDLICEKGNQVKVVQCKYWSSKKVIHENHINQLLGTTLKFYLERNKRSTFFDFVNAVQLKEIVPILITSTVLSETAKQFAEALCVEVVEDFKMAEYPMIKCNINRKTGEKIYHLPFDQQYDKVKIDGEGEFYAMNVQEAEDKGFRRAKKWVGDS